MADLGKTFYGYYDVQNAKGKPLAWNILVLHSFILMPYNDKALALNIYTNNALEWTL